MKKPYKKPQILILNIVKVTYGGVGSRNELMVGGMAPFRNPIS